MKPHEHIILPLDVPALDKAVSMVTELSGEVGVFKVGLELINNSRSSTMEMVAALKRAGAVKIFLDVKLHDIPNTVAGAMSGVVRSGAWCVTVHTMGGSAMLRAAVEAARREANALRIERPLVFGVTVLTSIGNDNLKHELKVNTSISAYAVHLAMMAKDAGCDGVIASPQETQALRAAIPSRNFLIVTPGVRPAGTEHGDQARVNTPGEAIMRGADYLVIGRPINSAPDPVSAARSIAREIEGAWNLV